MDITHECLGEMGEMGEIGRNGHESMKRTGCKLVGRNMLQKYWGENGMRKIGKKETQLAGKRWKRIAEEKWKRFSGENQAKIWIG